MMNRLKNSSIGDKLIMICMITTIASLITACITFIVYDKYSSKEVLRQEITVLADIVANRSTAALAFDDSDLATKNLKALSSHKSILTACMYTFTSIKPELFAEFSAQSTPCPDSDWIVSDYEDGGDNALLLNSKRSSDDSLSIVKLLYLDNQQIGLLYLESTLDHVAEQVRNQLIIAALAMLLAGFIALLVAKKLAVYISNPLHHLRHKAEEVAKSDDYSIRAEKETNDEVGSVVDSFNYMLSVIEKEDQQLRESEEKFRLISASSGIGIFQTDTSGNLTYSNQRLVEMTAYNARSSVERFIELVIHDEHCSKALFHWRQLTKEGGEITLECKLTHALEDGTHAWVSLHIGELKNNDQSVGFLGSLTDISEIKRAQAQLENMAFYDPLTGLANRRLFKDRLGQLLAEMDRTGIQVSLALLDLDNFKHVNDALGHDAGDELLKIIAKRLEQAVRKSDTVARIGGDEFALILFNTNEENALISVIKNVLESLRTPVTLNENNINVTGSIGIAQAKEGVSDINLLTKQSDMALYRAKDNGRNTYAFFSADMDKIVLERISIINDLNDALNEGQFSLAFQPQYDIETLKVVSFEALLRWIHPEKGFIGPDKFIPIAESTGQILDIGRWVITEACKTLSKLQNLNMIDDEVSMAINLSAKQFIDQNLLSTIKDGLDQFNLAPQQLEFELTETALMENIDQAIDIMNVMKDMGVSIAIDDFGTGYSSLSYLKKMPVDSLKIDRSFVMDIPDDIDDMAIASAVVAMAHELNFKVIAEGVETIEQLEFLKQTRCDLGQGYYMSKPLSEELLLDYLMQERAEVVRS